MPKITRHGGPSNAAVPPESVVEVAEEVEEVPKPNPADPYEGLLRVDLQKLLGDRNLPTSGNKEELVARLVAADEANAAAEDTTDEPAAEDGAEGE
jgi:hypothetical protein